MEVQGMEQEAGEHRGLFPEETGHDREHEVAATMQPMERSVSAERLELDHDAGGWRSSALELEQGFATSPRRKPMMRNVRFYVARHSQFSTNLVVNDSEMKEGCWFFVVCCIRQFL
ncbi:hypothetical protein D5086_003517 [Populus alba]